MNSLVLFSTYKQIGSCIRVGIKKIKRRYKGQGNKKRSSIHQVQKAGRHETRDTLFQNWFSLVLVLCYLVLVLVLVMVLVVVLIVVLVAVLQA